MQIILHNIISYYFFRYTVLCIPDGWHDVDFSNNVAGELVLAGETSKLFSSSDINVGKRGSGGGGGILCFGPPFCGEVFWRVFLGLFILVVSSGLSSSSLPPSLSYLGLHLKYKKKFCFYY